MEVVKTAVNAVMLTISVEHLAQGCPQEERLCYNCKKPGHESNACTLPRTSANQQCYQCQEMGHVKADCPGAKTERETLSSSWSHRQGVYQCTPRKCRQFQEGFEQKPKNCSHLLQMRRSKSLRQRLSGRSCKVLCMVCLYRQRCLMFSAKYGHLSSECDSKPAGTAAKACYRCGDVGHLSRQCPSANAEETAA